MSYYITTKKNDEYLAHHGVLGMHWGIRRYQNMDGTLTSVGKARYKTDSKFKAKIDNYKRKDELISEGHSKFSANLVNHYMKQGFDKKNAILKAEYVKDNIKLGAKTAVKTLAIAGPIAAAGLAASPMIPKMGEIALKTAASLASKGLIKGDPSKYSWQSEYATRANTRRYSEYYENVMGRIAESDGMNKARELADTLSSLSPEQSAGVMDFIEPFTKR